jgi:hypothetical protein
MFRLIGFLVGVFLALFVLAAVVDGPTRDRVKLLSADVAGTVLDALDRVLPGEAPAPRAPAAPADPEKRVTFDLELPEREPLPAPPLTDGNTDEAWSWSEEGDTDSVDPVFPEPGPESGLEAVAWQPIWTPFHSELSAKGFADRLEHLTGREYRVTRASSWSYQVEVAYADEAQRQALLLEIQERTGLALAGEQP